MPIGYKKGKNHKIELGTVTAKTIIGFMVCVILYIWHKRYIIDNLEKYIMDRRSILFR